MKPPEQIRLPERIQEVSVDSFGKEAGVLSQPAQFQFQYSGETPVSLTMDVRENPYNYGVIHPVFGQNLPEGYVRRYISEKLMRHADVNDLYLLAIQGDKGIGHLCFHSELEITTGEKVSLDEILQWQGREDLFPQLLDKYYLNGLLSGVQPKVMVPTGERSVIAQSDLIVKTFDDEFDLLTVNEYVCMSAAKAAGLKPPQFWLSEDQKCFVIERFDIQDGERLGFEDFTVLMGKSNDQKYRSSYESLLTAVRNYTRSPDELECAYWYIVFSCLIGNGDAHLKNFALQYNASRDRLTLAPPYDITHTLIYDHLDKNMALKMRSSKSFPDQKTLRLLGEDFGIKKPAQVIEEIADSIQDYLDSSAEVELMPGLKDSIYKSLAKAQTGPTPVKTVRHDKHRKYPG